MTGNEQAGHPVLGRLQSVEGRGVVVMEDHFSASIDRVWKALTDKDELAKWLGDFEGDLASGGSFHSRFHASGAEGNHRIIDTCEAPTHFRVVGVDGSGNDTVAIDATLKSDGDGTTVALTQSGLPLQWIAAFGAGMQVHFEDLALHLAGRERSNSDARMNELMPLYEEQVVVG